MKYLNLFCIKMTQKLVCSTPSLHHILKPCVAYGVAAYYSAVFYYAEQAGVDGKILWVMTRGGNSFWILTLSKGTS